jgi:choline dehydrogenase-like flavoprotein
MIVDARELDDGIAVDADVCVVGAGAAGIALALRLRGRGARVVVLESGGETQDARTQGLYVGENSGQPYFDLAISRLRFFGGSTNHWGGTCRPIDEEDLDRAPGNDMPGWPIGMREIAPYYDDAGTICGLDRPVGELDEAEAEDPTDPLPLDPGEFETRYNQIVDSGRRSFATRYRNELAEASDITVHLWANVIEVTTSPSGTRVTGARVATLTGVRYTVLSRVVVIATGGIENPRVLLTSTGAGPDGLGNRFGLVGRCFMEHPRFIAALLVPSDPDRSYEWYGGHNVRGIRYQGYTALAWDRQRAEGVTDVQLRLSPRYTPAFEAALESAEADAVDELAEWLTGDAEPLLGSDLLKITADLTTFGDWFVPGGPVPVPLPEALRRMLRGSSAERESLIPALFGNSAATLWERALSEPPVAYVEVTARIAQVPNPNSRVVLTDTVDELGVPQAELHWELSETDRLSVVRTIELFGAELAATGIGRAQLLMDETSDWPVDVRGGWHHMGTTRMSEEPQHGVVDPDCQVHDVENLFVAGSSVFPTATSATPTLTLVALALRLADHLLSEVL